MIHDIIHKKLVADHLQCTAANNTSPLQHGIPKNNAEHRPLHTKPPAVPGCPQGPLLVAAGSCCCGAIGTGRIARSSRSPGRNGSRDAYCADTRKKSRLLDASDSWPITN